MRAADFESAIVDSRFGIVRQLVEDPRRGGMPSAQRQWVAHVCDASRFGAPAVDRATFGNATNTSTARGAALGEAVERYCGNLVPPNLATATWNQLKEHMSEAVDPHDLALFSPGQYQEPGFPFQPFNRSSAVEWVEGQAMDSGDPILVPASLVYLNHRATLPTNPLVYAGIAAGRTEDEAHLSALYEIIERDATTIWWAQGGPTRPIHDAQEIAEVFDDVETESRTVRLHAIGNSFGLPVIAAFVEDHRRHLVGFGTACRHNPRQAATKALTEAYGLLEVARDLGDPMSALWDAYRDGLLPNGLFRAYRTDRAYRLSYRSDFRDIADLPSVAQLYLDPEMQGTPLDRLRRHDKAISIDQLSTTRDSDELHDVLQRVDSVGLQAVSVDLTTDDVAASNLRVVRVVVPGTYSNSPPAFPYLGGRRMSVDAFGAPWVSPQTIQPPIPLG